MYVWQEYHSVIFQPQMTLEFVKKGNITLLLPEGGELISQFFIHYF